MPRPAGRGRAPSLGTVLEAPVHPGLSPAQRGRKSPRGRFRTRDFSYLRFHLDSGKGVPRKGGHKQTTCSLVKTIFGLELPGARSRTETPRSRLRVLRGPPTDLRFVQISRLKFPESEVGKQPYRRLEKPCSGEEDVWGDPFSKRRSMGWRAVSAAGLQGKVSRKGSVFFTDTGIIPLQPLQ